VLVVVPVLMQGVSNDTVDDIMTRVDKRLKRCVVPSDRYRGFRNSVVQCRSPSGTLLFTIL